MTAQLDNNNITSDAIALAHSQLANHRDKPALGRAWKRLHQAVERGGRITGDSLGGLATCDGLNSCVQVLTPPTLSTSECYCLEIRSLR